MSVIFANAQDTTRKAAAKPVVTKPASKAAPVAVKSGIPINPKTGRPYSKWGYGANAKAYQAQKKADTLKKVVTPQPVTPAPVATAPATPVVVDKSLNGQYQYLLTKVYNYQQPFVAAFWKNIRDSLNNNRRQLKEVNDKLAASNQSINQLQTSVTAHETELSEADSVDFIGISFSKNGYSTMMWGLVLVLGAVAATVIFRSGSARSEAAYRTKLYSELEEEYKTYKAKANEKEKKLARELQTERNKVDELTGK
ncbi:hypothetical protein ACFQZS_16560 [Mucilaginibacter calamicampi]|uniref:Uncharacterized protein n=2 Tax=Mucilaginibacter calamicampi TaxID=1302352 RepID=A0ABW2YZ47_9SPHI